ncbi:MAG: phosphate ABC transporter permease PstA [Planctomycetaceae bacterium]
MSAANPAAVASTPSRSNPLARGRREGWLFRTVCGGAAWSSLLLLAILLASVLWMGAGRLSWDFLTRYDSAVSPEKAGVLAGLWGSLWLMILTMLTAVPVGIGAAISLEEYATDNWLTRLIRVNLSNLAGVPSIVYGILGLTAIVRMFGVFSNTDVSAIHLAGIRVPLPLGPSVLTGALTLGLLVLPVIIVAGQEALRAVPSSIREASFALGATKWQTIQHQVLPAALPGILTGIILAISRAVGETAPLIMVGAAVFYRHTPGGIETPLDAVRHPGQLLQAPFDSYTALPMQIYNWAKQPTEAHREAAAAGIIVLLAGLLVMNGLAIYLRNRYQKRMTP